MGLDATPLIESDQLWRIPPLGPMPPLTWSVQLPTAWMPLKALKG